MSDDQRLRDTCGCCQAPVRATPEPIANRPGLSAIAYRVGTFASFRQAMIEAAARTPGLRDWTSRERDDHGVALLEMWAYLADILTFYQERTANEAFLRTATRRHSVLRLAALLDYEPAPGVAATAFLAFRLEEGKQLRLPAGLRVQSVPGPDEKPQRFETLAEIEAASKLNRERIYPRPQPVAPATDPLAPGSADGVLDPATAAAVAADLRVGHRFVVFSRGGDPAPEVKEVTGLRQEGAVRRLAWRPAIVTPGRGVANARARRFTRTFRLFGYDAPGRYLHSYTTAAGELRWQEIMEGQIWPSPPANPQVDYTFDIPAGTTLQLDAVYDDLTAGARVLIPVPGGPAIETTVTDTRRVAARHGPLVATVTEITVADRFSTIPQRREAEVYELAGPEIAFWNHVYPPTIAGDTIYVPLDRLDAVPAGRTLILDDGSGEPQVVAVTATAHVSGHLAVTVAPPLTRSLAAATASLLGNVAAASHGEAVEGEVLGDGDAAVAFQTFRLRKAPVTHLPRPGAPHGVASTLEVRAGGVRWQPQPTLYGHGGAERVFTTTVDDAGATTVRFGDGVTGARLPSGRGNVVASYRQGLGRVGNVRAGSLTTLLGRPPGLRGVANPAAAVGGADPETLDEARVNAPLTVRTFGRIVSLRDFEDAARAFAGVAKARAVSVWEGEEQAVQLTVAGDAGAPVTGTTLANLVADLDARRDPHRKLTVIPHRAVPVQVEATALVDSDHVATEVATAATRALLAHFAFERSDLGRPVHLSDLYAVLQGVAGVVAIDIDRLQFKLPADRTRHGASAAPVQGRLGLLPSELPVFADPVADAVVRTRPA